MKTRTKVTQLSILHDHPGYPVVIFVRKDEEGWQQGKRYTLDTPHKFSDFYHKLYRMMSNNLMHRDFRINPPVALDVDDMSVMYTHFVTRNIETWEEIHRQQLREEY